MHSKIIFSINSHCSLNMKWLLFTINAPIKKIYASIMIAFKISFNFSIIYQLSISDIYFLYKGEFVKLFHSFKYSL